MTTYRIKDIEAHPGGVPVDLRLDRHFLQQALKDVGPSFDLDASTARVKGRLRFASGNVLFHGDLSGSLVVECQRCLGPASLSLAEPLHLTFVPADTQVSPDALDEGEEVLPQDPFDPDDIDYAHHDGETVDLGPVLRDYILLDLPITVVCREDCQGLCPSCGQNRNQGTCPCRPISPLSPFAALKDLKV